MTTTSLEIPIQELPRWMRQAQQRVNWGLLLVVALCLAAGWPFLTQPALPRTNASENYAFLTMNYGQALREGRLYPRWLPNTFNGYGSPLPAYIPPAAPLLAGLIDVLFTDDPVTAVRALYVLSLCMAGITTFSLVTRRAGAAAGVLAAVLYVYSPYVGLTTPHLLGDLSAALALGLLPGLLAAVNRLLLSNRPIDPLVSSCLMGALLLTDLRISLIGLLLTLMLLGWHLTFYRQWRFVLPVIGALLLGGTVAACFWMPALLEQPHVRWLPTQTPTYALSWPELITPLRQVDLNALLPEVQLTIGLAPLVFALLAAVIIITRRKQAGFYALFLLCGLLICAAALIFFPTQVWLLGPAALCFSISGSSVITLRARLKPRSEQLILPLALLIALALSFPVWLPPLPLALNNEISPLQEIYYEQLGYGIGSAPSGWAVPYTLPERMLTEQNRFLINGYQTDNLNRIAQSNQRGVEITVLAAETHGARYQICINPPVQLDYLAAYYPGWRAAVNGVAIDLSPNPQTGLMRLNIPMSLLNLPASPDITTQINCTLSGTLTVWLDTTPEQRWGILVTALSLLALVLWTRQRVKRWDRESDFEDLQLLTTSENRIVLLILIAFSAIIALFGTASSPFSLRARPGYGLDNSISITGQGRVVTSVGLEVLAYRLNQTTHHPGSPLDVTVYWRTSRSLPDNYSVELYLLDQQGTQWLRTNYGHIGGYPAQRWTTGQYVADHYTLQLSQTIVPGIYTIALEVYPCGVNCQPSLTPGRNFTRLLSFFGSDGDRIGVTLTLPTAITIIP